MEYEFKPSYENYRKILADIKQSGKYMDFVQAKTSDTFLVLRHDIEFSIDRAYALSLVESQEDVCSTYFVQITNNAYNAFSKKNLTLLKEMQKRGHYIGLHYHTNGQMDELSVRDGIRDQLRILSEMLGLNVDRYSIHRPPKQLYYYRIDIEGTINAYSPNFFTYTEHAENDDRLEIKYIADSKHRWNYAYPSAETFAKYSKIQLLVHPFSWTEEGFDNYGNFSSLIREKNNELIWTLDNEFLRFSEIKDQIVKNNLAMRE